MGYVYIMANGLGNVLYIGVTTDLIRRIEEHVSGCGSKFADKYNCHKLVYYEVFQTIDEAIRREKQLKWWHRQWKRDLIEKKNPRWVDLAKNLKANPSL